MLVTTLGQRYLSGHSIQIALVVLILLTLSYVAYQVYFHPLAKYPGPVLAKLTLGRLRYHVLKGDMHLDIRQCHDTYGPVVRYGPNLVVFNTTGAVKDIYSKDGGLRKPADYILLNLGGSKNILAGDGAREHGKHARAVGSMLTTSQLRAFEPQMLRHIHSFLQDIYPTTRDPASKGSAAWGPKVIMSDSIGHLAARITLGIVFGTSAGPSTTEIQDLLGNMQDALRLRAIAAWMPSFLALGSATSVFKRGKQGYADYRRFIRSQFDSSPPLDDSGSDNPLYSRLLKHKDRDGTTSLSVREIRSTSSLLILAGIDTTSTALCGTLFYLATNPHTYTTVAQEIRSRFATPADIHAGPTLQGCTYLQACIQETLRMSPPVSTLIPRITSPGGSYIDGHFIPPGSTVGTSIYSLHHEETYFPHPDVYSPERWIMATDNQEAPWPQLKASSEAYNPYSRGPTACLGRHLAQLELSLAVATIIWHFDFRVPDGSAVISGEARPGEKGRNNPREFQLWDYVVSVKYGPELQFRPR